MRGLIWGAGAVGLALLGVLAWYVPTYVTETAKPIRVGLLHSLTGAMAISEKSMVDAEEMALEELRADGLLGRQIEWVKADGASNPATFAREAERLIRDEKVSVIFGCWSSACRKSVKPVVEKNDGILVYPTAYEGMETSPNIFYTGAAPNQQIIPAVKYVLDTFKAQRFFLVGTDSIYPRSANALVKDQLRAFGATVAGEQYVDERPESIDALLAAVKEAKPDFILSTIEGELNVAFYRKFRTAGSGVASIPVLSFPLTEEELRELPVAEMRHDYLVTNYFQSIDRQENQDFVRRFKARFGKDRPTCDTIATAYTSVKLWAQAVRDAESPDPKLVRMSMPRQSINAPEGVVSIDRDTHHTWRPLYLGRIRSDAQVEILWSTTKPVRPAPFPFSRTAQEWNDFVDGLYKQWNGHWSAPSSRRDG